MHQEDRDEMYEKLCRSVMRPTGSRKLLFNKREWGGMPSIILPMVLFASPFVLFFAIFDTSLYKMMGHATSIIVYIIALIIVMVVTFLVIWYNNASALRMMRPAWEELFPGSRPEWILPRADAPYRDFFKLTQNFYAKHRRLPRYTEAKAMIDQLHHANSDLIEAMTRLPNKTY